MSRDCFMKLTCLKVVLVLNRSAVLSDLPRQLYSNQISCTQKHCVLVPNMSSPQRLECETSIFIELHDFTNIKFQYKLLDSAFERIK